MAMQGRTKRDFARHADYSEHYVGTVLRGLGPVSAAFAGKLSEYLDRPVDELFDQESAAS